MEHSSIEEMCVLCEQWMVFMIHNNQPGLEKMCHNRYITINQDQRKCATPIHDNQPGLEKIRSTFDLYGTNHQRYYKLNKFVGVY